MEASKNAELIIDEQRIKLNSIRYTAEKSYWELQEFICNLQQIAKSGTVGNLYMYGVEFSGYNKVLADKRSIKASKKFNEIKERLDYDLRSVRIM